MSTITNQSELSLQRMLDERDQNTKLHENLMAAVESSDNKTPTESQAEQIKLYRETATKLDAEIADTAEAVEANRRADEAAKLIRRAMAGSTDGVEVDGDGIVYRDFATYAHDNIITRQSENCSQIALLAGGEIVVSKAKERLQLLKRTPANTLSSNVGGLTAPQHIEQIFQVINKTRPLVASATRTTLERGVLTYPQVDTKPVVAVQTTQKTEAGNTGMAVSMQTTTASTYLGGGDLSWQAINWSTPDALQLWFALAAADYALKTEQDAAQALQHSGFTYNIATTLTGSYTFANLMTAIGAGYSDVFTNSGRTADTVWMAPDVFGYILGMTSTAFTQFTNVSGSNIGPLNIVVSRGMDAGVAVVGDKAGLLVAETAGAPVELRVVEPAIGGVEVGIIGAFEAVVVDAGAFAMITTAS
jgi:HK97 family phage major capsid protein